jgi:uncharacterized caspase-like protein
MANNWAIVVGINHYDFLPNASLKFAAADALAMQHFLCKEAGFDAEKILLCGDGKANSKATRAILRDILINKLEFANSPENLWFFFSGHGMTANDQKDYLITIDGNPNDLQETAVPIHFVIDRLRACNAKNIVLVLDMCRDESQEVGQKSIGFDRESLQRLVQERDDQQGIITLFSCSRGQSSYEIPERKQGAFTYALLEGLRSQSILKDLELHLARRVPELHREVDKPQRKQTPIVISEPAWKCEAPILSDYLTEVDISNLKRRAIEAENNGDVHRALQFWKYVNLRAANTEDRERAMNKIQDLTRMRTTDSSIDIALPSQIQSTQEIPQYPTLQQYSTVVEKVKNQRDSPLSQQIHNRFEKINSALKISSQTVISPQWIQSHPDFPWSICYFFLLGYLPMGVIFGLSGQESWVWVGTLIMIWSIVGLLIWSLTSNRLNSSVSPEGWELQISWGVCLVWLIAGVIAGGNISAWAWICPWAWVWLWTLGLLGTQASPALNWFGILTTPIVGMFAGYFTGIGYWWGLGCGLIALAQFSAIVGIPILFIYKKSIQKNIFRTVAICGIAPSMGLLMGGCIGWWINVHGGRITS